MGSPPGEAITPCVDERKDRGQSWTIQDVQQELRRLAPKLDRMLGHGIELVVSTSSETSPVRMRQGDLELILTGIVTNARDAMGQEGVIHIVTWIADAGSGIAPLSALLPDRHVVIAVRDRGPGMDPETLKRCTEPFFTGKDRGMGLGLSTARGIVERDGGKLVVESTSGEGTTVSIFLPLRTRYL